jgi:hypothetical protein
MASVNNNSIHGIQMEKALLPMHVPIIKKITLNAFYQLFLLLYFDVNDSRKYSKTYRG